MAITGGSGYFKVVDHVSRQPAVAKIRFDQLNQSVTVHDHTYTTANQILL